jgi:hypothetical protein
MIVDKGGEIMKRIVCLLLAVMFIVPSFCFAADNISTGQIDGMTVVAGLCSFIVWPGIGQAINENPTEKCLWHAGLGLIDLTGIPVVRLWSGYDALVDRHGGYWGGKI